MKEPELDTALALGATARGDAPDAGSVTRAPWA
jgi:hypothetical protein